MPCEKGYSPSAGNPAFKRRLNPLAPSASGHDESTHRAEKRYDQSVPPGAVGHRPKMGFFRVFGPCKTACPPFKNACTGILERRLFQNDQSPTAPSGTKATSTYSIAQRLRPLDFRYTSPPTVRFAEPGLLAFRVIRDCRASESDTYLGPLS